MLVVVSWSPMSSRLEIELTSTRPDGTWTWRKAGAKLPKGELPGTILPAGAAVGDVLKAEADIMVDGVDILSVAAPGRARVDRHQKLEIVGTSRNEELVITTLAPKGRGDRDRGDRGSRGDRGPRGDRDDRGPRNDRGPRSDRGPRGDGDRPSANRGPRSDRPRGTRPPEEVKPRAKRLRPGRTHRNAVLESINAEHRPIAEQVLRGGVPAVRQAVEKQNELNISQGMPPIHGEELVAIAEKLLPKLRSAEWRDKADNALTILEELDLRDLRSVVVAADAGARDDDSRAIAQQLRDALTRRVEEEHNAWLAELTQTLNEGRIVRALRLSSRPPKAGSPLPAEVSAKLVAQTTENLTAETTQDRWATVLDALVFSPVRTAVTPPSIPAEPNDALKAAVSKAASRLPQIAAMFGIEPSAAPARPKRSSGSGAGSSKKPAAKAKKEPKAPVTETEAPEPTEATEATEAPVAETEAPTPETEAPETEAPAAEAESEA